MMSEQSSGWFVYILECADTTLYTGITNNLDKRLSAHSAGKGAKYTKVRLPVKLRYTEKTTDRSSALKREYELKQLPRSRKILLLNL